MDMFGMENGDVLSTHDPEKCRGQWCCVHNPSHHAMREFRLEWKASRRLMERICSHDVGHPDPDDIAFRRKIIGDNYANMMAVHTCDGCCQFGETYGK